jgi:hypothetical protein
VQKSSATGTYVAANTPVTAPSHRSGAPSDQLCKLCRHPKHVPIPIGTGESVGKGQSNVGQTMVKPWTNNDQTLNKQRIRSFVE